VPSRQARRARLRKPGPASPRVAAGGPRFWAWVVPRASDCCAWCSTWPPGAWSPFRAGTAVAGTAG